MNMASLAAHSVAEQSGELHSIHRKVPPKLQSPDFKPPTRKDAALHGRHICGSTPCMLNKSDGKAEVLRPEPCTTTNSLPSYSSLRANRLIGGSRHELHQVGLPQLQMPDVNCQRTLTPNNGDLLVETNVECAATSATRSSIVDRYFVDKRPRTIEEALKILDGFEEDSHSDANPSLHKTSHTRVNGTVEPHALQENKSDMQTTPVTNDSTLLCSSKTRKIHSPFIGAAAGNSISNPRVARHPPVDQQRNSEPEEERAAPKPLGVDLISSLTDDEHHADVQILVARSMRLATIDPKKGACDWKNFTALSVVSLSHNCLTDISPLSVLAPTLIEINVNFNHLSDLSPLFSCTRLQRLSAAHNHVSSIAGIGNCKDIRTLILYHNCLQGDFSRILAHLCSLSKLKELDIDGNPLIAPGNTGTHSDLEGASADPESSAEGDDACRIQQLQSPSPSLAKRSLIRKLLRYCPSLEILGGVDVQQFSFSATTSANVLETGATRQQNSGSAEVSQAKILMPATALSVSDELGPSLSVAQKVTSADTQGQSSAKKRDHARSAGDPSQVQAEDASSDDPPVSEGCTDEVESGAEELGATSDLEKLKTHIRGLRRENRNMYALLEENEKLRLRLQHNQDCSLAASSCIFASRSQSARPSFQPIAIGDMGTLCSASARPCTAAPLKNNKKTTRASRDFSSVPISSEKDALCGKVAAHLSTEEKPSTCPADPTSLANWDLPGREEQPSGASPSQDQNIKAVPLDKQAQEKRGCNRPVQDDTDDQQTTAALKWENSLLKQRLDRMVKYVQLLREDLDQARLSGIQRIEAAPQSYQATKKFPPYDTEGSSDRVPIRSLSLGGAEEGPRGARTRGKRACVEEGISGVHPTPNSMRSTRSDARHRSHSDLDATSCSSSSDSETMEQPQSPAPKSVVSNGDFKQQATPARPDTSRRAENDTLQQTGDKRPSIDAPVTSLSRDGVPGGAFPPTREGTTSGQRPRPQLTLQREDVELAGLLERNKENVTAVQRELRDPEWMLSRPTSASSCVTQVTARTAAPSRVPSKSWEKKSENTTPCDVTPKRVAQHRTPQENLMRTVGMGGYLPPSAPAKDEERDGRTCKVEKPVSKHEVLGGRSACNHHQQSKDSVIKATGTGIAARVQNSGNSIMVKSHGQKLLTNGVREKEITRQRSMHAAGEKAKSVLLPSLTESFTSSSPRLRCPKHVGSGTQGSTPSRQPVARCSLPPLPRKTNQVKGSFE